ncbi:MAG TPA: AAA family ATPase [Candidatus Eisenbergiella merdipullorum]|uniref:AAA family ATPase n=1 Tax=Candidatus Eisenbergiella merdipullorum TaxID=2838553 RepID=A0A9D2L052_9FIRM|nr:AAA family ATPase [Candidatus Eisenbergiella merdipullorum]
MGKYLNVGSAGFEAIRKGIYVDKTEMISFINQTLGTTDKLTCVSRPRRFGKSYAAKMLCAYYDKSCDSRALFDGLAISKDPSFEKYRNRYNVIYLDITLFISMADNIRSVVKDMETAVAEELQQIFPDVKKDRSLAGMLFNIVEAGTGKFIMIIDEWDALFREAKTDLELQKEYIDLLRGLFKSSWTDVIFEAVYMTGILPIKRYGTQSAVSDFREYTMLSPGKLVSYIGFTEQEVRSLCGQYDMDFEEMKYWYDGYSFRRLESVYSPNSVMEAIKRDEFGSYWTRTETYESLKIYIDLDADGLKEAIIQMLAGDQVRVDVGTFQNDMTNIRKKDDVLTLLVHLGYLAYDSEQEKVYIPNEEVKKEFLRAVSTSRHREMVRLIQDSDRLLEQTLNMDEKAVASMIEEIHKEIGAPLSYNNEDSLRSTIRFAYIACDEDYTRDEELPAGHGYADIVYRPKKGVSMPAILIELKWNKTADAAIQQIRDKDYPNALKDYGGDILLVGINYNERTKRHSCRIEKITK